MLIDSPDWDDYPNDWFGLHLYEPANIIRNDDNNILTIRMTNGKISKTKQLC